MLCFDEPREPDEWEHRLADFCTYIAGIAIEREQSRQTLKRVNQSLERLNDVSCELMDSDVREIADRTAELAQDVLDTEYVGLWRYDGNTGELTQHAGHTDPETAASTGRFPEEFTDHVWNTFVGNDITIWNDPSGVEGAASGPSPGSHVLVPLGRHGVLCAGSLRTGTFDARLIDLAETVAATVETAWDRAEGERQLADRNEELERLDRLNALIRGIDQTLVEADTLADIHEAVCERLADSDLYEFAWIGDPDPVTDTIEPRAWAGVDGGYLDDLAITLDDISDGRGPIATAVRTGELQVVADIATDTRSAPWREITLERGARSCISIPLDYGEFQYGVLTVYADRPLPDERDHEVLAELGRTIAHAINARETRATLRTDSVVELTLRFREADASLCRLARRTGCEIEFEGFVPRSDSESDVFFTARGVSPEDLQAAGERSLAFTELRRITERTDGSLFRARVSDPTLAARCVEYGAVVRTLTIDHGTATAVLDLPHTAEVRKFLDRLRHHYPALELCARRPCERPLKTRQTFVTAVEDRLTARQRDVLQTAYLSGFFESPRASTGQEVTELLGISQPTFSQHLRAAERSICELVFDEA